MKAKLKKVLGRLPKGYAGKAIKLYFLLLFISIVLYLMYPWFPSTNVCATLFQEPFCAPFGLVSALIISVPGYFLVGNLLPFLSNFPWWISLVLVVLVSALFFAGLGKLLDKYLESKTKNKSVSLLIALFILLLLLFLGLLIVL